MAGKWSPNKEHRGPQSLRPSYEKLLRREDKTNLKGLTSNDGSGSEGGENMSVGPAPKGKHGSPQPKDKIGKVVGNEITDKPQGDTPSYMKGGLTSIRGLVNHGPVLRITDGKPRPDQDHATNLEGVQGISGKGSERIENPDLPKIEKMHKRSTL